MKKKTLVIGAIATTAVVVGGFALAQSVGPGPGHFGPRFMESGGSEMMGFGMRQHMGGQMGMGGQKGMGMHKGPGLGRGMQGGPGFGFADSTQLESLKRELGITGAQEPAWNKYATAIRDAATAIKTTREGIDPNTVSKMTPQDRYAFVTKMREQGQQRFDTVKTAADELLAALDDTQRAKARDVLPSLASVGRGPMRGAFMRGPRHSHEDE